MRASAPFPHTAPNIDDIAVLLELIAEAEAAYQRLIGRHLEHAERTLTEHAAACGIPAAGEQ